MKYIPHKQKNNKKLLVTVMSITLIGAIGIGIYSKSNESYVRVNGSSVFVRNIQGLEYSANSLNIMGYEEVDYAQAISFILTKAKSSSNGIEGINLNGISIKEHIKNLCEVSYLEGINPNIMIAQQILETSVYAFGYEKINEDGSRTYVKSMVKPTDNNYCGLGAVDGGNSGNSFSSNREGQLAQAQHLKAYASEEPLNGEEADVRFKFVNRGVAPTVAGLSKTWASDKEYGDSIARIYTELMNHQTDEEILKQYADKVF